MRACSFRDGPERHEGTKVHCEARHPCLDTQRDQKLDKLRTKELQHGSGRMNAHMFALSTAGQGCPNRISIKRF